MISFVPFAFSYQTDYPDDFPKFVLSIGEVSLGTEPSSLFQVAIFTDEVNYIIEWDLLYISLLQRAIYEFRHRNDLNDE